MKWPQELLLIRHAPSTYNQLKHLIGLDEDYRRFLTVYAKHPQSDQARSLARQLHDRYPGNQGDMSTPLAHDGHVLSVRLGQYLRDHASLPDVVYVSPYVRTWATLSGVLEGWPELGAVRLIEEERIREQEFGLRLLYSDWRFYLALHADQQQLFDLQGAYWYRYPQGENVADVRDRNRSWMNTLVHDFADKRVLAITHHLNILAFRANMSRLNSSQFLDLDAKHKPANCSITTYRGHADLGQDGHFLLESYKDLSTD